MRVVNRSRQHALWFLCFAALLFTNGCFTTLKTAKTVEGGSLTLGAQRYVTEENHVVDGDVRTVAEHHYFLVVLGRAGQAARSDRIGWEIGARVVSDIIDHPGTRDAGWFITLEPRIQLPRNRYLDVSLGIELMSFVYPGGASIYLSRDVTSWLTPYAELKAQLLLWQVLHGERDNGLFPRITLGTALGSSRVGTFYVETEGYTNISTDDSWRINVGYELPPMTGQEAGPDSLRD